MKTLYIFKINNYFSYLYQNKPYRIYKILEEIYNTNQHDIVLSYKLFEQIANPFNKTKCNKQLTNYLSNNINYCFHDSIHIICSNDEYSKLTISNANMKIKSNVNMPIFLKYIEDSNLFICDFNNKNYFWLDKLAKTDCIKENNYVK